MEGVSGVSSAQGQGFDTEAMEWEAQLNDVSSQNNGWQNNTQLNNQFSNSNNVTEVNQGMPPEVREALTNFIGNMGMEMFKNQNPAQKISMGDDE